MSGEIFQIDENMNLSHTNMIKTVIRLSIPAIMAQITSIAMQYIDAAMVGSLGAEASAAIGLVSSTTWLIGGLCVAAATGFSVQAAHFIGACREDDARNVFRQSLIITSIFGLLLTVIAVSISGSLPVWLGGDTGIQKAASEYFLIYACALPATQCRQLAGGMLQCSGDMRTPSVLNILLCALDVVFNFFLIFPARTITVLGFSFNVFGANMGVAGAALGTALAEVCTAAGMLYAACVRSEKLAFRLGGSWRIQKQCMKTAAKISLPAAFEHTVLCSAYVASTLIVAPLGTVSVAAHSLAVTAESFCYMPGYGFASAATTLVGLSMGAKQYPMARKFARMSVLMGVIVMSLTGVVMFFAAPWIFAMLTPAAEVQRLGTQVLRIEVFAEPLYAASIVCAGALRGAGDTLIPSILNLVSMWGVRITAAVLLIPYFGLHGMWIAMCGELCVRGILFLIRLFREKWLKKGIVL